MAPIRRRITLAISLLTATFLVVGCGGEDSGYRDLTGEPFTDQNREDFTLNLDKIRDLSDQGLCEDAQSKVEALTLAVEGVAPDTDEQLKNDMIELLGRLGDQVSNDCSSIDETTSTDDSTDVTTTDTDEEPTSTTTSTSTETTTDDTTVEPPPDPDDGGNGGDTPPSPGQGGTPGGGTGTPTPVDPGGPSGGITPREAR